MAVLPGHIAMNPLERSPEEYRAAFQRITDLSLALLSELRERPTFPEISGEQSLDRFQHPLPEQGLGQSALDDLQAVIDASRLPNPRFFGYVLGSGEPIAAAADMLASVLNQNVTAWRSGPAAAVIEKTVVGWLARALGCPKFAGSLTGGGSSANLMALAMARESRLPANEKGMIARGTIYASEQVHMSIPKAVALLGIGRQQLRLVPCDSDHRIRLDRLRRALDDDRQAGLVPLAIIGSAGTVSTGSIDPLRELATVAHQANAWFHVDGAFGALAAIARPDLFDGLARANSISLDPHKWLYQPLDCGCVLYRDRDIPRKTFSYTGDYAKSLLDDPVESFVFFDETLELSRRFRALKVWLSLRYHGFSAFRQAIQHDLQLAAELARLIDDHPALERLAPVPLSAVCFRFVPSAANLSETRLNELNLQLMNRLQRGGRVYLSNATIDGRFALRVCIVNHRTTRADIEAAVEEVIKVGSEIVAEAQP
jgi:glutamate/tyrosine decarboxylase-like PLP-dependent enzyme